MGRPEREREREREIRLILSVGKPHESNKWHMIMGTSFLHVIINMDSLHFNPRRWQYSKLVNSAVCLVFLRLIASQTF